ncbi:MAG: hypothetical protein ACKVX7_04500 [Planctomycetota bacterium]
MTTKFGDMPRARQSPAKSRKSTAAKQSTLERALVELDHARAPLHRELKLIEAEERACPPTTPRAPEHLCCTRQFNVMRITPLEAIAIARAFRRNARLKSRIETVRARIRAEAARLAKTERRQRFECPLLAGTRCLVHSVAKPIGCLAWNPGREYSQAGWDAFLKRDVLNEETFGPRWPLQAIPLLLARYFDAAEFDPPPSTRGRQKKQRRA